MAPQDVQDVPVDEAGIRLGQFLKLAGIAESGAHARALLEEGEVRVDGELEQRRGRQLATGAVVVVSLPDGEHAFRVA
ncbi:MULTISPECIES: RNA-binding S4 domain-containing protein [unclassified Actinotalea]|uniref:RNA-binding S4 domain-containing protein n=1 Tax=unclassified Actinotalea TaxID=2638618 RepID=UPI0021023BC9|nr:MULTISPECIES: RNA-binding S4 domain-containing protein [unclassified Actinotalea]